MACVVGAFIVAGAPAFAQGDDPINHVRGAVYRLEPAPNYAQSLGKAGNELTDGRTGEGRIWTSGEAAGWSWRMPVTITLDLPQRASVEHVRLHTASGTHAGVYRPSQVLVFGGDGAGTFDFLGASPLSHDRDSSPSPKAEALDIRFARHEISQLMVVVFARGPFVFVSEIEAFGPSAGGRSPVGMLPSAAAAQAFAGEHRRAAIAGLPGPKPTGPDVTRRWAMPLDERSAPLASEAGCAIERVDPWEAVVAAPRGGTPEVPDWSAPLVALTGGRDYAAWRIVNRASTEAAVTVSVAAPASVGTTVLALAHVQALNYEWVADAVVPFQGTILPGRSAMLVRIEAQAREAGRHTLEAFIVCGSAGRSFAMKLLAVGTDPEMPVLHGNVWTYLHEPRHAPVDRALVCEADFLARHGIDTVTVHPAALFPAGAERPTELLRRYFETHRDAARLLLYMDIKTRTWPFAAMSDEDAAQWLATWWGWVQDVAREARVAGELLLYPIDEPRFEDITAMRRFHHLAGRAAIDARIYATLEHRALAILPWVDVAQLHRPSALGKGLAGLLGHQEIHGYDTKEDAKLLPPNGYYRRQGWDAYALGLAGVGVWSAWDSTGLGAPETGWDPFTGQRERDFGLLYASPGGCAWPSLRLLAWRRGLEENRLLRQCAKRVEASRVVDDMIAGGFGDAARRVAEVAEGCVQ